MDYGGHDFLYEYTYFPKTYFISTTTLPMMLIPSFSEAFRRLAEEEGGTPHVDTLTESEIIKSACAVYLSIFAILFLVFLIVRAQTQVHFQQR